MYYIHKKSLVLVGLLIVAISGTALAKTYRWVDADGKVHYSQSIPPSAAQNGHSELSNKSGRVMSDVASSSERKKARVKLIQLKAKEAAEKMALREEMTLLMFNSREELEKHFDERLEMVSVNLRLFQYHKRKLQKNIEKKQHRLAKSKNAARKKTLSKELQKMQSVLLEHTRAIEANQREQTEIDLNKKRAMRKYDQKAGGGLGISDLTDDLLIDNEKKEKSDCACTCEKKLLKPSNKS